MMRRRVLLARVRRQRLQATEQVNSSRQAENLGLRQIAHSALFLSLPLEPRALDSVDTAQSPIASESDRVGVSSELYIEVAI